MAKKKRSAKQRAATRKLVALNRSRGSKKRKKRRRSSTKSKTRRRASTKRKTRRKSNKAPKRKKSMAGRKGLGKITSNPTLKKILMAAGAVTIATSVAAIVAPSLAPTIQSPIVRAGLGFVAGDFVGAVSNFVLAGGGGLVGGGGNGGGGNTGGFA